ncbi:MAG TPA: L,D-transpeptidase family protein [Flavobacteriaceae bacterium]|nr:L,D-transpeptidase family protein [Flavobacteriaceae bacterium]
MKVSLQNIEETYKQFDTDKNMIQFTRTKISFIFMLASILFFGCKNEEDTILATSEEIKTTLSNADIESGKNVRDFYNNREYAAAWNNEEFRNSFLSELKKADEEGLSSSNYQVEKLQNSLKKVNELNEKERVKLELTLTEAFFDYAHDLYYGKTNPTKMYEIWGLQRKEINFSEALNRAVENNSITSVLEELKPQTEIYKDLKKSLAEYRHKLEKEKSFQKIAEGDAIEPGDKDPRIPEIAARLKQLGILNEKYISQDSLYNEELQAAVKVFQKHKILATDQIIGNSTIEQLNMGPQDRYNQILVNLERWRWFPRDFGSHYILINIPNYELDVIENGKIVRVHNVIAGDKTHHTPIFSDSIQYIVLNPQWHIPSSIASREIIPSARKNSNYLSSRNIYVTNSEGKRIDPSKINWKNAESYSFTQGSGAGNALGHVKIIYPNKYAIYLHDTPAKAIFEQNSRAESHGCVRVEDALKLAAYLLSDQKDWDMEKIQETIASGKTVKIKVTQPVKVYHLYWTAWRENGESVFANDVYNLDDGIYEALSR